MRRCPFFPLSFLFFLMRWGVIYIYVYIYPVFGWLVGWVGGFVID